MISERQMRAAVEAIRDAVGDGPISYERIARAALEAAEREAGTIDRHTAGVLRSYEARIRALKYPPAIHDKTEG